MPTPPKRHQSLYVPKWPKELEHFTQRDIEWCYNFLINTSVNVSLSEKQNFIINFLANNRNYIYNLYNNSQYNFDEKLLDELRHGNIVDVSWILPDDQRLLIWLLHANIPGFIPFDTTNNCSFQNHVGFSSVVYPSTNLSVEQRYSSIIEYIDSIRFNTVDANPKQEYLNSIKNKWITIKTHDNLTNWIDKDNNDQLVWAWEYLIKCEKFAKIPKPLNKHEYYTSILASLDLFYNFQPNPFNNGLNTNFSERELFINKFSKAWSQKKFRDSGKHKKDYHLPLTKKTKECLEKLAKLSNKKENEILEELINKEFIDKFKDSHGNTLY